MQSPSTQRLFQLSYLRAFVTLLVVVHHSVLAYFSIKLPLLSIPISDVVKWPGFDLLVAWNDIFFMALMFFVSGLFVWPGLKRHSAGGYLRRRLLRLGIPFVVGAGVLAPLTYYPGYLQAGGAPHLAGYVSWWFALGTWPAGPMWFLWVLFAFDCVPALVFTLLPNAFETLARGVRGVSNRPVLFFLLLAALSCAAYAPMAIHFGKGAWWSWGPFAVQTSRVLHYFIYFAMGACLGAFGADVPMFERTGPLARRRLLWGLTMVVAFVALIKFTLAGKEVATALVFPVSCAASSLYAIALVIRFVRPWRWADSLSANAYGIYIVHYAFVTWLQYWALQWPVPGFVKGVAVSLAAIGASWMTAVLLRQSRRSPGWFDLTQSKVGIRLPSTDRRVRY